MTTHEINEHGQVVPYTGGRLCTDTRAWRDATELELAQREEIRELEARIHELADMLDATNEMNIKHVNEANRYRDALQKIASGMGGDMLGTYGLTTVDMMQTARAALSEPAQQPR